MLLTEARRPARTGPDDSLVPLAEQDRARWDQGLIAEGVALVSDALSRTRLGPYQLQAAIAAIHDEAPSVDETDWAQMLALYDCSSGRRRARWSRSTAPSRWRWSAGRPPGSTCWRRSRPTIGWRATTGCTPSAPTSSSAPATTAAARDSYRTAARLASNVPERRYLDAKAASLTPVGGVVGW